MFTWFKSGWSKTKAFLAKLSWRHVLGLLVSAAAAVASEVFQVKHAVLVAVSAAILTRIDKILGE